jgi:hypothetical protein
VAAKSVAVSVPGPAAAHVLDAIGRPLAIIVMRNCALVDVIAERSELVTARRPPAALARCAAGGG